MGIRDVLLLVIVLGGLPFMVRLPYIGVLFWSWIGLMNPHRLSYGFAYAFPFAQLVGIATLAGLFFSREERGWKSRPEVYILILLLCWMSITTLQALEPQAASEQWVRVMKIQVFTFVALIVLHTRRHVEAMVWVLALSIGYYGFKGGIFTILTGGQYRVWGPPSSYIEDNNSLALATVMIIPLLYHLFSQTDRKWMKIGLAGAAALCAVSVLGSHSRGALLAIGAMTALLWLHSRHKIVLGALLVFTVPILLSFMPQNWSDRMGTIVNYENEGSANARLHTWTMLFNLANDRFFGGGFEPYSPATFARYLPEYGTVHSAHSIYFQFLGEHGWVGLLLMLTMWFFTWRTSSWNIKATRGRPELQWAHSLSSMLRVSLIGYLVGGSFLNLGYWDLPYYELVLLVVVRDILVRQAQSAPVQGVAQPTATGPPVYGAPARQG